jgi:cell division protein ZapA
VSRQRQGGRQSVTVLIAGERHVLRSDAPPEYTHAVAAHVDATIRSVGPSQPLEAHRAAILAALFITDELFRTREELRGLREEIERRSARSPTCWSGTRRRSSPEIGLHRPTRLRAPFPCRLGSSRRSGGCVGAPAASMFLVWPFLPRSYPAPWVSPPADLETDARCEGGPRVGSRAEESTRASSPPPSRRRRPSARRRSSPARRRRSAPRRSGSARRPAAATRSSAPSAGSRSGRRRSTASSSCSTRRSRRRTARRGRRPAGAGSDEPRRRSSGRG